MSLKEILKKEHQLEKMLEELYESIPVEISIQFDDPAFRDNCIAIELRIKNKKFAYITDNDDLKPVFPKKMIDILSIMDFDAGIVNFEYPEAETDRSIVGKYEVFEDIFENCRVNYPRAQKKVILEKAKKDWEIRKAILKEIRGEK